MIGMKLLKDVLNANIILTTMIKFKKKRKTSAQLRISVSLMKREEIKIHAQFFEKVISKNKIQANNELNVFVNEMSNIFEDVEDSLMPKYIV
jgi:hypothetical protein